ncbi:MAG: class I SAM-dependent methyltransferase [Nitrospirota bacterium]|nr:class I SAM-dependent methyltransferase [Nitrospirota bacterium]
MNIYKQDFARIYDDIIGDMLFAWWKETFEALAPLHDIRSDVVADIACGTGSVVHYFADKGRMVVGTDASPEMLAVAREKNRDFSNASFLEQGFTDLSLPFAADLVTCNGDSLNYLLDEDDLKTTLNLISQSLKPGGWFFFDMNTVHYLRTGWDTKTWLMRGETAWSVWSTAWDEDEKINILTMHNFIETEKGLYRLHTESHEEKGYELDAIKGFLGKAGFSEIHLYDGLTRGPVTAESTRAQFLAKKAE